MRKRMSDDHYPETHYLENSDYDYSVPDSDHPEIGIL
mgnify:CR=1 FL=1